MTAKNPNSTRPRLKAGQTPLMPAKGSNYSPNQMKFMMELLRNGGNQSAAYRTAYDYEGPHAGRHALQVLKRPGVRELLASMQERAYAAAGIDAAQVLGATAQVAFSNLRDLHDKKGKAIPIHKLPRGIAAAVKKVEAVLDRKGKQVGTVYEMRDSLKALGMIGNHLGIFKPDGGAEVNVNLVVERMNAGRQRALEARNAARDARPVDVVVEAIDE